MQETWIRSLGSRYFHCTRRHSVWEIRLGCSVNSVWLSNFLVVQWLRNHLPMQGTHIWSLVLEDSTGCKAAKLVHHNCWASSQGLWATTTEPMHLEAVLWNKRSHLNEKPTHPKSSPCSPQLEEDHEQQRRPRMAKNKQITMPDSQVWVWRRRRYGLASRFPRHHLYRDT